MAAAALKEARHGPLSSLTKVTRFGELDRASGDEAEKTKAGDSNSPQPVSSLARSHLTT